MPEKHADVYAVRAASSGGQYNQETTESSMKHHIELDLDFLPPFQGFPKEGIDFLRRLKKNNTRSWFQEHKMEYEENVKLPMQSLIGALKSKMMTLAPEFEVNPKRSMFRIYRDIRFSKDKSPYKTHVAAVFHLKGRPWENSAGFYIHIEPGEVYAGGGIYMPDGRQLKTIRQTIAGNAKEFLAILSRPSFRRKFSSLEGEQLRRPPKGFPSDHPMVEWLKYKSYFTGTQLEEKKCHSPRFVDGVISIYSELLPLVRFLNHALERNS